MAKGYPARQEATVLPECKSCGSSRFREAGRGLRCEDCDARLEDPFKS
jgi:tRNA(Ile2) C34 agmatinyltransferase TiaS